MFKRNDGMGDNAIQNRFTALLKKSLHNNRINYMISYNKILYKELPLGQYSNYIRKDYDFVKTIVDCDAVRSALKTLSERERKIIVLHIIEDEDFNEISKEFGLTYKGTATVFYRAITKLRDTLGRY